MPAKRNDVTMAMATLCCDGFDDGNFEFAYATMPRLGVRNVEFNCWYARNLTTSGIDRISRRSEEVGLTPVSLHVPGYTAGTSGDLAREVTRWAWLIQACRRLDISMLKATGSARGQGGGLSGLISVLSHIAPMAAEAGVTLALENHFANVLEFVEDYEVVFDAIPDDNVGLCLDTGHFAASGVNMMEVIERLGSRLVHIDLKDCASEGGGDQFVPFGEGVVDFPAVLRAALESGYRGYLVVEFPRRSVDLMEGDLRRGMAIAEPYLTP